MQEASVHIEERVAVWANAMLAARLSLVVGLVVAAVLAVNYTRAGADGGAGDPEIVVTPSPSPGPSPSPSPTPSASPAPTASPLVSPTPEITPTPSPTPSPSPTPTPSAVSLDASAGSDQVVIAGSFVVLDGTVAGGSRLGQVFSWRQLDGPLVELNGAQTANPSFTAGDSEEVYLFALTVQGDDRALDVDMVVVATRTEGQISPPVAAAPTTGVPDRFARAQREVPPVVRTVFNPLNILLVVLSVLATLLVLFDRVYHFLSQSGLRDLVAGWRERRGALQRVRVVHYQTNESVAGAKVIVRGSDGAVVTQKRTSLGGSLNVALGPGSYTLEIAARGFTFSPAAATLRTREDEVLYAGGQLAIVDPPQSLSMVIPMKPTGDAIGTIEMQLLKLWQAVQGIGHRLTWPLFVVGAVLNTVLMLLLVSPGYVAIEVTYVVLVLIKIMMEVRFRPSFGLVRDAITHVPLDLAVVRLYEYKTNRLVLTRVTNSRGRFFALPAAGTYNVVVSKTGYASFTRENVKVEGGHDRSLDIKASLMPLAPQALAVPVPVR